MRAALLLALAVPAIAQTTAQRVLGQRDFFHSSPGWVEGREFFGPCCVAVDRANNRLYVADSENNRILAWASATGFSNGQVADRVIGQPDLFTTAAGGGAAGLANPQGLAVDAAGNLWVADTDNHRVVRFTSPFSQTPPLRADLVLGQADLNTALEGVAADRMSRPAAVATIFQNNTLVVAVADTSNSRVLVFTNVVSGAAAGKVIGQPDFTSSAPNNGSARGRLYAPLSVVFNAAGHIFVGDSGNSRVLRFKRWNELAAAAAEAEQVVGQANFESACTVAGPNCIVTPAGEANTLALAIRGNDDLLIADQAGHRMLVFPLITASPAQNAFAQATIGGPGSAVTSCGALGATSADNRTFNGPTGVALDSQNAVHVVDSGNHRLLSFPFGGAQATRVLGQPGFTQSALNYADGRGLATPSGLAVDRSANPNHLFVADFVNNRVLGWRNAAALSDGQPADLVLGQPDFNTTAPSSLNLNCPVDVAVDGSGNLYVAYQDPGMVAVFNRPFESGARNPVRQFELFGSQPFEKVAAGIAVDNAGNLWAALPYTHRVVQYPPNAGSGAQPSRVFGQRDFVATQPNQNLPAPTNSSLNFPLAVAVTAGGDALFIADSENHRVLEFAGPNSRPPVAGAATRVYGQSSFVSRDIGSGDAGLIRPAGLSPDNSGHLWIVDSENNRLLHFLRAAETPAAGPRAVRVIGQPDFFRGFAGVGPEALATSLGGETESFGRNGLGFTGQGLMFLADRNNHRILQFAALVPRTVVAFSGDNQGGPTGRVLPQPLVAQVLDGTTPVPGVTVTFTVQASSGEGRLSVTSALTDGNGRVSTTFTPVSSSGGQLRVNAEIAGVGVAAFTINVTGRLPAILPGGVVNGASFRPAPSPVSPGAIVSAFGADFLPAGTAPIFAERIPLPETLGGVTVFFNEFRAPLFYVSAGQINCQVPVQLTGATAQVRVIRDGDSGDPVEVSLSESSPGVFTKTASGSGAAVVLNQNGTLNAPAAAEARGNVIQIFATGQGPVTPLVASGQAGPVPPAATTLPISVTIGSVAAPVEFSGLAPGFVGLWQINARIPATAPTGDAVQMLVFVGPRSSNPTTISVK